MKRINFDFQQLIAFVAVAERNSFKLAAEAIDLSTPALSRRIEKLESTLGVRLFNRTTREVKLTPVGRSFLERVQVTLGQLEETALNIGDIADLYIGQITIACIPSTIDSLLTKPIERLLKNYPKIKVKILDGSESSVIENVRNGKADFGLGFLSSPIPGIIFEKIQNDIFVALTKLTDPLAIHDKLEWDQLNGQRLITIGQESGNRQVLNTQLLDKDLSSSICIEANRVSSLPNLVSAGFGIGIIPLLSFNQKNHSDLKTIPLINPVLSRGIGVITAHGGKLSPVADLLLGKIKNS
ncbi:LysR family transcriptional regulator [Polynucleobacter tropicus]|uniref:LysR family transcriptional regulator n=1 Tax=Polynucleobacter tropicus TaxID=1743174 RepID=A0A6M9PYB0_9BURK|nr:LysR family transcriptional regulator [Polynucleobacter tropicus]QKM65231.1 LysR family transcriptional regulator [Polynucleobacter tropicus]